MQDAQDRTLKKHLADLHEPETLQGQHLSARNAQHGAAWVSQLGYHKHCTCNTGEKQKQVRHSVEIAALQVEGEEETLHDEGPR